MAEEHGPGKNVATRPEEILLFLKKNQLPVFIMIFLVSGFLRNGAPA